MAEIIKVGMADLKTCKAPDGITTLGLGSCVGVAIVDKVNRIGGLAHVMLPDSTVMKDVTNIAKFADTGVVELVKQMEKLGAVRSRMVAKIAGGAQMFSFDSQSTLMRVGERNAEACRTVLKKLGIPILAEDCGENYGRTVVFYPETGVYEIRTVGKGTKNI
ncbi:MAG: chemotaxis protein CheD [Lachnospiraceae bacterium]|nr:chemotaxis protein CheD [Lachnospiraceae bacterium]MBR4992989.1 chemotaxis protein CheD [Lachnospiraceae bacterium]MBR5945250.1 chemotaxis protein CheD [Lachnospiraceae bacterium]